MNSLLLSLWVEQKFEESDWEDMDFETASVCMDFMVLIQGVLY